MLNPRDMLQLSRAEEREFAAMDKAMREAATWLDDPAVFQLAHPARLSATPATAPNITLMSIAEPRHQPLVRELLAKRMATIDVFQELERRGDRRLLTFYSMHTGTAEASGGFGNGAAGATAQSLRFLTCAGRIYSFSDELVQLLDRTKLGTDIPVSELKLPSQQPNIYIELGTARDPTGRHALFNAESGYHALEGAYVSSVHDSDGNDCLEVTMTGSPVGHTELMDDAVEWVCMKAAGQVTISQALTDAYTKSVGHAEPGAYFDDQARLLDQVRASAPRLELITKCILFLGLPEAVKKSILEGTEARKALARAQSGAHRRRAARVLARSYDRVLVEAPPIPAAAEDSPREGRTVGTHWRDGHLRNQRHGPGFSLTKVIWIRPMLINADAIASE